MSDDSATNKESKIDISFSWRLFLDNYKAFLSTEFFAIGASLISFFVITIVVIVIGISNIWIEHIVFVFIPIIVITFQIFMTSQFGLAYDILSSGDMYAVFKGTFKYFQRHWLQYFVLIIISSVMDSVTRRLSLFIYIDNNKFDFLVSGVNQWFILAVIVQFIWRMIFIFTFPSVTATNSIKLAFKENFSILKKDPKRVIRTFTYLFIIFRVPFIILWELLVIGYTLQIISPAIAGFLFFLSFLLGLSANLIELPLSALIATRIYNTILRKEVLL